MAVANRCGDFLGVSQWNKFLSLSVAFLANVCSFYVLDVSIVDSFRSCQIKSTSSENMTKRVIQKILKISTSSEAMGQTKKAKITFTCSHELRHTLEEIAVSEDRTLSNLVERLVAKAVKDYKSPSLDTQ